MIYVDINIAKLNHYAAVLSSDGVVLTEPFKFTNDGDGFKLLHSELFRLRQGGKIVSARRRLTKSTQS